MNLRKETTDTSVFDTNIKVSILLMNRKPKDARSLLESLNVSLLQYCLDKSIRLTKSPVYHRFTIQQTFVLHEKIRMIREILDTPLAERFRNDIERRIKEFEDQSILRVRDRLHDSLNSQL